MTTRTALKKSDIDVPENWTLDIDGKTLFRNLVFKDFKQAWAFMDKVAKKADAMDHHPDWSNVYNKVKITLSTHDAGGVTILDIDLATFINSVLDSAA